MKKILFLLLIIILSSGCYDYRELNDLAIVSGISIDYQDDFLVTYEILSTKNNNESDNTSKSYLVSGNGKTISEAILNTNNKVSLTPTMSHIKTIIIDENIAKYHLKETTDYLIRDPLIHNAIYLCVASKNSSKEILSSSTKENEVVSESIANLIKKSDNSKSIATLDTFEEFISKTLDKYLDGKLNVIEKQDEALYISGLALFKDDNFVTYLNKEDSGLLNILTNSSNNYLKKVKCNDKDYITISLYENKNNKIDITDKINIKANLTGKIIEDNCNFDFKDPNNYNEVSNLFTNVLKEDINDLLNKLKENQTDILGINNIYYKNNRTRLDNWYTYENNITVNLNINRNGLVFEVNQNE